MLHHSPKFLAIVDDLAVDNDLSPAETRVFRYIAHALINAIVAGRVVELPGRAKMANDLGVDRAQLARLRASLGRTGAVPQLLAICDELYSSLAATAAGRAA